MEDEDIKQEFLNPWQVTSKDEFLFYCCPECDITAKDYKVFYEHAIESHPRSKGSLDQLDEEHVKEELKDKHPNDQNDKFEIQSDDTTDIDGLRDPQVCLGQSSVRVGGTVVERYGCTEQD